ncbi:DgyrCDS7243 [Dimorphilus gyrociliatus]|uniref:DgyrCDS7243 n=1 Tax=Dimorphilus gyrociliatus TaxID=2664684 RepID=A0A7I8VQP1_9ANNE|nr:DgyrCDS7243 [Dimorphilus gyrociliatus]
MKALELIGKTYYQDINECESELGKKCHFNNGICLNTFGSFSCSCRHGFELISEAICSDVDECSILKNESCPIGEYCFNTIGSFECVTKQRAIKAEKLKKSNLKICPKGTWGKNCSNTCGACKNHLNCNSITGVCKNGCDNGFITKYCNKTSTLLISNKLTKKNSDIRLKRRNKRCHPIYSCHGYGMCIRGECKCMTGYFGSDCRQVSGFYMLEKSWAIDGFRPMSMSTQSLLECRNNCIANNCLAFEFDHFAKGKNCFLIDDYTPSFRENRTVHKWSYIDINECLSNPCRNNGSYCQNLVGSFLCLHNQPRSLVSTSSRNLNVTFPITFTVISNLNPALENPASIEFNEASNDLSKELRDIIEDSLGRSVTIGIASAIEDDSKNKRSKRYASLTNWKILGCELNPCQNGGACLYDAEKQRKECFCPPNYYGSWCQHFESSCSKKCGEKAICRNVGKQCACLPGWTGKYCQERIEDGVCPLLFCGERGVCRKNDFDSKTLSSGQYECLCEDNWTGTNCKWEKAGCLKDPCQNGGTCTVFEVGRILKFQCSCPEGFRGLYCQQDTLNPCKSSECIHGVCKPTGSSYECICKTGYAGRWCEVEENDKWKDTSTSDESTTNMDNIGFWVSLTVLLLVAIGLFAIIVYCLIEFCTLIWGKMQKPSD